LQVKFNNFENKKMKLTLPDGKWIDTDQPLDISIPLTNDNNNPRAWYVDPPRFEPVRANGFIGSVEEGGSVNFRDIYFNPHGHGTHTECLGHITTEVFSINQRLKTFLCKAMLVTVNPDPSTNSLDGKVDNIIRIDEFMKYEPGDDIEAIVIRTLPNNEDKKHTNYSAQNPPFLDIGCLEFFDKHSIKHLLIDMPSVDREEDGGKLIFHHEFWKVNENTNSLRTITEMIYVANDIEDGNYLLELQVAPFENDAAPSRPVLYRLNG
jgi:kynurenine formamidase